MLATPVTMPRLGESVTEGTILRWLKSEGEEISVDEPLCEVETDKVTAELPSPFSGTVQSFLVEEGKTVDVGVEIALVETNDIATEDEQAAPALHEHVAEANGSSRSGDSAVATETAPANASNGEPRAAGMQSAATLRRTRSSPVVRKIAAEHGVSISEVPGTGLDGRVTKKDIERHVRELEAAPEFPAPDPAAPEYVAPPKEERRAPQRVDLHDGDEVVDLTGTRRAIASRMSLSKREAPHAWTMVEVDVSGLAALREREKSEFERREGVKLTHLPFIVRAVAASLKEHPVLNSVWDEDRTVLRKKVNLGIAVDLDDSLVVPVIPDADGLSLTGLARAVDERVRRARSGELRPENVSGGTFTVNNPGALGSVVSTPIINYPQAAILSAEAVVKRPVVVEGDAIAVRRVMNLEVSFDHRILDGGAALKFLNAVKRRLESLGPESGLD